jgi:tetratricopeptide (TPR) repeat protein
MGYARFRLVSLGDPRGALEVLADALRVATNSGDREAEVGIRSYRSAALNLLGRYRELLAESEAAIRLAEGDTRAGADLMGYSPAIFALALQGTAKSALGDIAGGERDARRALTLAAREPASPIVGMSNGWTAMNAWFSGDASASMRCGRDALEVASKLGHSFLEAWGHMALGQAHLLRESWTDAVGAFESSLAIIRRHRTAILEAIVLDFLAAAHLGAGNTERARALADEAIAAAERRGAVGWGYRGHLTLARVLLRSGGAAARAAIETALTEAQALVDRTEARSEQPHIHLARAELADALGDGETRRRELREAHRLFTEIGATGWAERAVKALDE